MPFPPVILGQSCPQLQTAQLYSEGLVSGPDPLFSLSPPGEGKVPRLVGHSL